MSNAPSARLNMKKTKGFWSMEKKKQQLTFDKIQWVKSVTSLGAEFGYGINYEALWMKKFAKFKEKIKRWSKRDLSFEGKKLFINAFIMSSLAYLCDIYTADIPDIFISETKDLI